MKTTRGAWILSLVLAGAMPACAGMSSAFDSTTAQPEPGRSARTLHEAVAAGDVGLARELLSSGVPVDLVNEDGLTPLMLLGACHDEDAAVRLGALLLGFGADVHHTDKRGWTPLHWALKTQADMKLIRLLVNAGASVNAAASDGATVLRMAIDTCQIARVKYFLDLPGLAACTPAEGDVYEAHARSRRCDSQSTRDVGPSTEGAEMAALIHARCNAKP